MTRKHSKETTQYSDFETQSDSPEAVMEWVRRRLSTQPIHQVRAWAKAQYKDAHAVLRRYGSDIKCERARKEVESAKRHRRWIAQIRRALDAVERRRRGTLPFWKRTRIGVWGHEVQTYEAQQAASFGDSRHPWSLHQHAGAVRTWPTTPQSTPPPR